MDKNDHLEILSATITEHARKIAADEWAKKHFPILKQILTNWGDWRTGYLDHRY
jgi:hypothetical protein